MTLSKMTLSKMTVSKTTLERDIQHNDSQSNGTRYTNVVTSVVMLSGANKPIMLIVVMQFMEVMFCKTCPTAPTTFPTRTSGNGAGYPSGRLQLPMREEVRLG